MRTGTCQYEGKSIAELAEMMGKHPMDAMLDLAIDEGLRTEFTFDSAQGTDRKAVSEILNHPYTHPCVSDGGAHTRYQTLGTWPVNMIADRGQRPGHDEPGEGPLQDEQPACHDCRVSPTAASSRKGSPQTSSSTTWTTWGSSLTAPVYDTDFPGGERRIIQKAKGIRFTIVNGEVTFTEGTVCTGATPGKLLRSYDMVSR